MTFEKSPFQGRIKIFLDGFPHRTNARRDKLLCFFCQLPRLIRVVPLRSFENCLGIFAQGMVYDYSFASQLDRFLQQTTQLV